MEIFLTSLGMMGVGRGRRSGWASGPKIREWSWQSTKGLSLSESLSAENIF